MTNLRLLFLLALILSTGFLEIEAKKHTRRHTFLLKSRVYSKNNPKSSNLVERKKLLLQKKTNSASKTKIADTFLLPLVILNTGLQLITTIVNIGVKHQEQHLKNLKEKQLKRLYVFKSKADSTKRATCLSIIRVVSMFGDFFDWLRIEMFAIQIEESEKVKTNVMSGDFVYNEALSEEQKDEEENKVMIQNEKNLCTTNACMSQVIKVNAIKTIINGLRNSKNQILEFQNTFCDLGHDLIGEENYYNARTMGILESIYPKKSESKAGKILGKIWGGFNDVLGIFEEVVWVNQGIAENYMNAEKSLKDSIDAGITDPNKIKPLEDKVKAAKESFDSNNLIRDVTKDYLPNEFGNKEKKWSTWYVRHVIIGNPAYGHIGKMNSVKKSVWSKIKIITSGTIFNREKEVVSDSEVRKKVAPSGIQKGLAALELIQLLFPFLFYLIFILSFGIMGGSKIINTFFSVFAFLNLIGEFFTYGIARLTIACLKLKLDPENKTYNATPYSAHIKKELEKSLAAAEKSRKSGVRGIVWYTFLLLTPFLFHAGLKWLMRIAAKSGKEAAWGLMNNLLTAILVFKLVKNVVMLILAIRKYYDLKSRVEKITAEEDIEMKIRENYLGNLSVQLQYVFIKFNLVIYNGLSGFLSSFRSVIKDGNPILKGTTEEDEVDNEYYRKRAESLLGPNYKEKPRGLDKKIEDSLPLIAAFKETEDLKRTDFKNYLIVRYMPRQHFIMNLATENVDLVYRYKKYIMNKFYNEKNTNPNFLANFQKQFSKFLNQLFFTAPISNPMIFKLSSFADSPSLLHYSDLNIMKHESFPDDYVCIYQKSFYSNSYLRGVKSYRFTLSGKLDQYNEFFQSVEKLKEDKNLTDIFYMNNDEDGFIYAVVFVSWNTEKILDIENFKTTRSGGNDIVFMNKLLGSTKNINVLSYFSDGLYDASNDKYENEAELEIELSTFKIVGKNDPFARYYENFVILHQNPLAKEGKPENGEKAVSCTPAFTFSYYHINCRPDSEDLENKENVSDNNKLIICPASGQNKQAPNDKRKDVMRHFLLPNADKNECAFDFVTSAPVLLEANDNDEMNLILDLKTRELQSEEEKKNDPKKHIKEGEDQLEETVESFRLDVKETACKQITRLKHVIYGCYTDLIARKTEFDVFYEVKISDKDPKKFRDFYMESFLDKAEKKLVQPTLSQFREKFHGFIVKACGLDANQMSRESMHDFTAFGFLYGHSEKPAGVDSLDKVDKKLKDVNSKMTVKSLKGKQLFKALEADKTCFEETLVNKERRFIFPLKKHNRDNSLVFTVFFILPYKKEVDKKTQAEDYKVQFVYSLQDTNEAFLNKYTTLKQSENTSPVRGLTMGTEDEEKDSKGNEKAEDGASYTKRMAKLNMGPEALFKVFEYYFVEVWSSYKRDKDSAMHLTDDNGVIENLVDTGFVPYWPRTVPVITNDGAFKRNYDNLMYYYRDIKPPNEEEENAVDYLEFYEEFNATSDFFFFFQYNEGNWTGTFFNSQKEKVIAYRLWVKFDFDMSKVEMELECPAQE